MKILSIALCFLFAACASEPVRTPMPANDQYGISSGTGETILIPQWHLSPSTMTTVSSAGLPQSENQRAIYRQLVDWVEAGRVHEVIVEGCEGEIADGFSEHYNGWTLRDLQTLSAEQLDNVMTQVGIKLKAKVGRKARVVCGDSNELIKKHLLILSDLRGLLGFRVRIEQYKDDVKRRADYVATVRDLLKLPADADEIDVMNKLNSELRGKLSDFSQVLHARNSSFVAQALKAEKPDAIVIGAIHIEDLKAQLLQAKLSTQTFTPRGLKGDEAELLGEVQKLLDAPTKQDSGPAAP